MIPLEFGSELTNMWRS